MKIYISATSDVLPSVVDANQVFAELTELGNNPLDTSNTYIEMRDELMRRVNNLELKMQSTNGRLVFIKKPEYSRHYDKGVIALGARDDIYVAIVYDKLRDDIPYYVMSNIPEPNGFRDYIYWSTSRLDVATKWAKSLLKGK